MENLESQNTGENMASGTIIKEKLPNATTVLILGIVSLILACCCGGLIGLVPAIIGVVLSSRDEILYKEDSTRYIESSYSNLRAGKIMSIIGIILNAMILIFSIFYFFAVLHGSFDNIMEQYRSAIHDAQV